MKRRRPRSLVAPPMGKRSDRGLEVCPHCGHKSHRGQGRIVQPHSGRAVCVRCGSEIRRDTR